MWAVDVRNVTKRFRDIAALNEVSFTVARGEALCLVGPSGCGKTTLLRIVAGLERPDAGHVVLNGVHANGPGAFLTPAARGIGMVFQDLALWPHMSAERHLDFVLRAANYTRAQRRARAAQLLDLLSLTDRARARPSELSGGQQQRLAIARALAHAPEILLLDEPFSNLNAELREPIVAAIRRLKQERRMTILLAAHHPDHAAALADAILEMKYGQ